MKEKEHERIVGSIGMNDLTQLVYIGAQKACSSNNIPNVLGEMQDIQCRTRCNVGAHIPLVRRLLQPLSEASFNEC